MIHALVVQHVEPEGPYAIGTALAAAGVAIDVVRVFAGEGLPEDLSGYGGVVVMGGPMSARSDKGFPSRQAELALLTQAVAAGVPTLGVCLGAQLLALAGGSDIYRGSAGPEIGWGTVELHPDAKDDDLLGGLADLESSGGLDSELTVLHWHHDTFDLPPGATFLASTDSYVQAFRLGDSAWGLQFHVEVDSVAVSAFSHAFGDEARAAGVDPSSLVTDAAARLALMGPARDVLVGRFAARVANISTP